MMVDLCDESVTQIHKMLCQLLVCICCLFSGVALKAKWYQFAASKKLFFLGNSDI